MPIPISLESPPIGRRYDPTTIDATGKTIGQVLTVIDDGSGGKRSSWEDNDAAGGDPGVATGTPGNWSFNFVPTAGGKFVLGAHAVGVESLGTAYYRRVLNAGTYVYGQAHVTDAGYSTAYLDCRVSTNGGASWLPTLLGLKVPLKTAKLAIGFAIPVDAGFVGDVLLDAVVVGGNGIAVPKIKSFVIESVSAEPPPATGEDGPIIPGIPQSGNLIAEWYLTEGSGLSVANKKTGSGGTPALALTSSDGGANPTWVTSPRRINLPAHPSFQHTMLMSPASLPDLSAGFAYFFVMKLIGNSNAKFLSALASLASIGRSRSGYITTGTAGSVPGFAASMHQNTGGGGGTIISAVGSTAFALGNYYMLGLIATGTRLKLVVNGVVEANVACGPLLSAANEQLHIGWPSNNLSFAVGPDDCDAGDPLFYAAAGIDFTAGELLSLYEQYKLIYTALP